MVCCWNYCSFDMLSLVTFAFNMFDLDGSGELERVRAGHAAPAVSVTGRRVTPLPRWSGRPQDEVQELVRDVYGAKYLENQHLHQVIKRLDRDGDGRVSYGAPAHAALRGALRCPHRQRGATPTPPAAHRPAEFVAFFRKYPVILFPAFTVQQTLRQRTFGAARRVHRPTYPFPAFSASPAAAGSPTEPVPSPPHVSSSLRSCPPDRAAPPQGKDLCVRASGWREGREEKGCPLGAVRRR